MWARANWRVRLTQSVGEDRDSSRLATLSLGREDME